MFRLILELRLKFMCNWLSLVQTHIVIHLLCVVATAYSKCCVHLQLCAGCSYTHGFLYHIVYVHVWDLFVCIYVCTSAYVCMLYCVSSAPWRT